MLEEPGKLQGRPVDIRNLLLLLRQIHIRRKILEIHLLYNLL